MLTHLLTFQTQPDKKKSNIERLLDESIFFALGYLLPISLHHLFLQSISLCSSFVSLFPLVLFPSVSGRPLSPSLGGSGGDSAW